MRIGIITNYHLRQVGGAEAAIDEVATAWHERGHNVRLFSAPIGKGANERIWEPKYRHIDFPRPRSARFSLGPIVRQVVAEHRGDPLDVLLACDIYWAGHVAHRVWQRCGVPFVLWSQGSDVMHGSRFVRRRLTQHRLQAAIRDAHGVVAISRYMQGRIHALAQPRGIERIIPNGWPDVWARMPPAARLIRSPYLFAMGRAIRLKGFQTVIEAYARLTGRFERFGLVVAGDGPYRTALIAQARSLGLTVHEELPSDGELRGVCLPGTVHGETKRSLLTHATLGVCPSIRQEPMALVLFEMLSCGLPVVASKVGGSPDIVLPGKNGALFQAGNVAELASTIAELLEVPQRLESLRNEASCSVAPFRWSRIAETHLELLIDVAHNLAGPSRRAA